MTDASRILSGSYKGIPISIDGGSVSGGRKVAIKQFPGRDTQLVEDLGQKTRAWSLDIVINDKHGQDYFDYRDSLLAALDSKGAGVLIHPMYGRLEGVVAVSYSLNETFTEFGSATVSVQFEVSNNTGIPQRSENLSPDVVASNDLVVSAVKNDITNNLVVTPGFTGNLRAVADKITEAADRAFSAASYHGEAIIGLDEYFDVVEKFADDAVYLASQPAILADRFVNLIDRIDTIYDNAHARFDALRDLFLFGIGDILQSAVTAGQIERRKNSIVINGAMNCLALGHAYHSSIDIQYVTTRHVDETLDILESQYRFIIDGETDQSVKDALTDLRMVTLAAIDGIRLRTESIVTIETTPTTCRLLSFAYYGSDNNGEVIANLNGIDDVSFVSGNVEILTDASQG